MQLTKLAELEMTRAHKASVDFEKMYGREAYNELDRLSGPALIRVGDPYVGFHADWLNLDGPSKSARFIQGEHAADTVADIIAALDETSNPWGSK